MKFNTLVHNGPLFPAKYQYKGFKVNGKALPEFAENMLWHWAILGEDYRKDKVFQKNFASTFLLQVPKDFPKNFPDGYESCIKSMQEENERIKEEKKKANTKEARELKKAENEKLKEKYGWAIIDGKKQPIGGFILEPEGIFIGRGKSPLRGMWKWEILPEDVTINFIGDKSKIPQPPEGHNWKDVVENHNAFTTVYYDIRIGNDYVTLHKKFNFGAVSDIKQNSDIEKYRKAQELSKNWSKMEKWIEDGIKKDNEAALISWLILRTGIRVGVARSEVFENGVVGASSLLVKNIELKGNNIKLDFVGKDSVRYVNTFEVPDFVAAMIKNLISGKNPNDKVFSTSVAAVNNFLSECVPCCTAKLFRTAYGTQLLAEELQKSGITKDMPSWKIKSIYDNACLAVSKKLNHQKNVAKNFNEQMDKTDENIKKAEEKKKEKNERVKLQIKKLKEKKSLYKSKYSGADLKEKLEAIKEKEEKLFSQLEKVEMRVEKLKANKNLKKETKTIALGTAKGAYSSPLIAASMCKDLDISPDVIYNKTMQKKFSWAFEDGVVTKTFWRNYPNENSKIK